MTDGRQERERMLAAPFTPGETGSPEGDQLKALNYVALYLGEIAKRLDRIAIAVEAGAAKARR